MSLSILCLCWTQSILLHKKLLSIAVICISFFNVCLAAYIYLILISLLLHLDLIEPLSCISFLLALRLVQYTIYNRVISMSNTNIIVIRHVLLIDSKIDKVYIHFSASRAGNDDCKVHFLCRSTNMMLLNDMWWWYRGTTMRCYLFLSRTSNLATSFHQKNVLFVIAQTSW